MFATPHGKIQTPMFMPVGTLGSVKSLDGEDLRQLGAEIILANTYHLFLRPGLKLLKKMGGLHRLMNWSGPILTDSGGFQVFSLGDRVRVEEDGVWFKSPLDGSEQFLSPRAAVEAQRIIGADIMMAFDWCAPHAATRAEQEAVVVRTQKWAEESLAAWQARGGLSAYGQPQALFGIVQGGADIKLRRQAALDLCQLPFTGFAAGGESIGYQMAASRKILPVLDEVLPENKPRYAMGLGGSPQDLVDAALAGFDLFDCVAPTRQARNGALLVGELKIKGNQPPKFVSDFAKSRLNIGNAQFAADHQPIQKNCDCATCQNGYSRAYLHHLYRNRELTYYRLASIHNLRIMIRTMTSLRAWILAKS